MNSISTLRLARAAAAAAVLATIAQAQTTYQIFDLTERGGPYGVLQSEARGVNEAGDVVGYEVLLDVEYGARGILWRRGVNGAVEFLSNLPDDETTLAYRVSEAGVPIGESQDVRVEHIGHQTRYYITPKAAIWPTSGAPVDLNSLISGEDDFELKSATGINAAGQIVGSGSRPGEFLRTGFLLDTDASVTQLGALADVYGVSADATVVGAGFGGGGTHAMRWSEGTLSDLHFNPPLTGVTSRAWDVNSAGLIVGEGQVLISNPEEPVLWDGSSVTRLVPEITRVQGVASAMNNRGQVVGFYIDLDNLEDTFHGFLWQDGARVDLLDRIINADEGWQSLLPLDINEKGVIVGGGVRNGTLGHAWIMIPIIPGDLDLDADVDLTDLAILLTDFGCPGGGCTGDVDGDGDTDLTDLAILLANFGTNA